VNPRLKFGDFAFKTRNIRRAGRDAGDGRQYRGEKFVPDGVYRFGAAERKSGKERAGKDRVQLIHDAQALNAGIVFGNPGAGRKAGITAVSGFGCYRQREPLP
jgi:hypothetical protein